MIELLIGYFIIALGFGLFMAVMRPKAWASDGVDFIVSMVLGIFWPVLLVIIILGRLVGK